MTFAERLEKLEPRERKLLGVLAGIVAALVVLAVPIYAWSAVSSSRTENDEIRALIDEVYKARLSVAERKAKQDALLARYGRPAPALAGFIEDAAKQNGITIADAQDKPEVPHGKKYTERLTVVKMHKVGMLALVKTIEKIEQSGHAVAVTRLNIRPRAGEPDSYEVELGVSAYDRKPDAKEKDKDKDKGESKDTAEEEKTP
ncbi:type II secretion system protein GspM [Polyangium jinanense]|uniref:Type II secretion system protein M n=1 Tax=Polyangium jinanense TaxID=2829994 RepID=A0A9X3X0Z8_9BACT|nr:type II secretion system protein GspM [Polyangium jinanense]MDC3952917.1 type II secretion system protein M [Polyangium jinanense]MDC3980535.1 type II secretion system protein M [Polyangium jinanense]